MKEKGIFRTFQIHTSNRSKIITRKCQLVFRLLYAYHLYLREKGFLLCKLFAKVEIDSISTFEAYSELLAMALIIFGTVVRIKLTPPITQMHVHFAGKKTNWACHSTMLLWVYIEKRRFYFLLSL